MTDPPGGPPERSNGQRDRVRREPLLHRRRRPACVGAVGDGPGQHVCVHGAVVVWALLRGIWSAPHAWDGHHRGLWRVHGGILQRLWLVPARLVHTQLLLPARLSGHVRPPNPPSPGKNGKKQLTRKSPRNVPSIIIFAGLEFSYLFNCAAHFAMADGDTAASAALTRAAGAFGAVAAASGFYMVGYELCRDVFPFELPVGDTSRFFGRRKLC